MIFNTSGGGGGASGLLVTISMNYNSDEDIVYLADKTAGEIYAALETGITPVFKFINYTDSDSINYVGVKTICPYNTDGMKIYFASYINAIIADSSSDYPTMTSTPTFTGGDN